MEQLLIAYLKRLTDSVLLGATMQDRITVIEQVYHQPEGKSPTLSDSRYDRLLESKGQPYKRIELEVSEEWQPLIPQGCWLDKPGMIFITNEEGRYFAVNPTQEELEAINRRVLLISERQTDLDSWMVHPRESFKGNHTNPLGLKVRCEKGQAKYNITVYPA